MKQINIKNKLYLLLTLLFCICLQATETTQLNTKPTSIETFSDLDNQLTQQAFNDFELDSSMRRPTPHHAKPQKPKPNGVGSSHMTTPQNMFESQQNASGSFDLSFGAGGGYVIETMGFKSAPRAVTVQKDNKIVVAGIRDDYPLLVRYTDNGELDKNFGVGTYGPGVTIQTSLGKNSWFNAVAIQAHCCDQKIVAVGSAAGKGIVARYHEGGTLDTTFVDKGILRTNIDGEFNAVAIQKDHKIVAAGYKKINTGDTQIIVVRYNEDGSIDTSFGTPFGTPGIAVTYVGRLVRAHAIAIQEDHKIVVVGSVNAGHQHNIVIVRYHEDGTLDKNFGLDKSGVITLNNVGKNSSIAYDVVVQKNGNIVVVGSSISQNDKSQFTIIRLQEDGLRDTSFGTDGVIAIIPTIIGHPNDNAYARSVALDNDENIIVMGSTITTTNDNYFSLVRYNKNASLDTIFGNQGIQNSLLTLNNKPNKITIPAIGSIQQDKKKLIVVSMYSDIVSPTSGLMAVARYHN